MISLALRRPHLIAVLALALLVLGGVSYHLIPSDLLPIFRTPAVQIVTFYPGMPPEVMERDIMSRLERWTGQSVGIEHQEAKAMLGVSVVKDFFREGISLDTAMSQVTSYAVSDMFYLPPGTIPPMVMPFDPTASVPLCLVSVSSPTMSEKKLYDVAYFELRNRLQSIQGVIAPAVYGGVLRRILAYVDPDKLASRGLAPMDVVAALQRQNVFIPAGNLKAGDLDYQIFANAMPPRVADLDNIPVAMVEGRPVLLRDVARAADSHQIQTNIVRLNGRRQVYIPIYRQPGANTIQIVDAIRAQLDRIGQRLREMDAASQDLALSVVLDQSVYVRSAIRGLQVAVILGALLAGLVVMFFLRSFISTLAIVMAIPLSLLAAFAGLYFTGDTINAMTLGGLALAVGILVDQSIVVLENILRHMRRGEDSWEAALNGATEVAMPILVSTITFVVVFYPILFLSGMARFLFKPLAVAASLAITASYLIAITGVPVFCALFIKNPGGADRAAAGEEAAASPDDGGKAGGWQDRFSSLLQSAIRRRWAVLAATLGVFILSVFLLGRAGSELVPRVDAGQFQITMRLPSGTRIENTEKAVARVEEAVTQVIGPADPAYPRRENHPDSNLRMLISNIGVLMDWPAAYTPNTGPMDAFLLVQLKGKRGKPGTFETIRLLREKLPEVLPQAEFAFDGGGMLSAALN
ncbi:MAG: efflux RND transporter permease subunit, partial [Acidobacteriota bacterium]